MKDKIWHLPNTATGLLSLVHGGLRVHLSINSYTYIRLYTWTRLCSDSHFGKHWWMDEFSIVPADGYPSDG